MATRPTENEPTAWERYKPLAAAAFGILAFLLLVRMFFFDSSSSTTPKRNSNSKSSLSSSSSRTKTTEVSGASPAQVREQKQELAPPQPIIYNPETAAAPDAGRNIFSFYTPTPKPAPSASGIIATTTPQPTPQPAPPLILASVSPANVYARTGDFTLDVTGDKFTPAARVNFDGRELPTRFVSPQQLSASVPAALIAGDGARQISVRTPDGTLFSNNATLNVQPPPVPNYVYVGIIGGQRFNDTAVVKERNGNDLLNLQRGDTVGGRFRVTSISERELVLTDTQLRIKHALPLTGDAASVNNPGNRGSGPTPIARPPQAADDDNEP
ncbi:MAG: IPT/TIG domain-containing protein [Pyrinomonadaceae bacterium]